MCGYNVKVAPPGQFVHPDAVKQLNVLAHQHEETDIGFLSNRDFLLDVYFSSPAHVGEFPDNWIGRA